VNRLVPSTKARQNEASSSSDPRRRIGTIDSTRARPSGSSARLARRNSGKSMKLLPTALTCTPLRATSPATLRTSMVAPARAAE